MNQLSSWPATIIELASSNLKTTISSAWPCFWRLGEILATHLLRRQFEVRVSVARLGEMCSDVVCFSVEPRSCSVMISPSYCIFC